MRELPSLPNQGKAVIKNTGGDIVNETSLYKKYNLPPKTASVINIPSNDLPNNHPENQNLYYKDENKFLR